MLVLDDSTHGLSKGGHCMPDLKGKGLLAQRTILNVDEVVRNAFTKAKKDDCCQGWFNHSGKYTVELSTGQMIRKTHRVASVLCSLLIDYLPNLMLAPKWWLFDLSHVKF